MRDTRQINLIGTGGRRLMEGKLDRCWELIDHVHTIARERFGDRGQVSYARVGLMRPGEGVPLHYDGIDGVLERRYQIALKSVPGADIIVDGHRACFAPGEAWWIDVSRFHSVQNGSDCDRIVILFDTKA